MSESEKSIQDYLNTIANEIAIDEYLYKSDSACPAQYGYIPRFSRYKSIASRFVFIGVFAKCAKFIWLYGGALFFYFISFLLSVLRCLCIRKIDLNSTKVIYGDNYIFAHSLISAKNIINTAGVERGIVVFFKKKEKIESNKFIHTDIYSLITFSEVFYCFINSCVSFNVLRKRQSTKKWILQSYTAFQWFIGRAALSKLDGYFYMNDHFDRYALLIDSVARRKNNSSSSIKLTLVQHGMLYTNSSSLEFGEFPIHIKHKLQAVTTLYAYDLESAKVFKNAILSHTCGLITEVKYFKPTIQLTKVICALNKFKILFVGHPLAENTQLNLHSLLINSSEGEFLIFYKPHPTTGHSKIIEQRTWSIIKDSDFFPEVDVVISYPSTLAYEYQLKGIKVITHAFSESPSEIRLICTKVLNLKKGLF